MVIKKADLKEIGEDLFYIDNAAFNRDFDLKSRSVKEETDYLQNSEIYVAYEGVKTIGFIAYEDKQDSVEIISLAVIPEYQKKGIGKLLLNQILDGLKGRKIHLVTHPRNTPAIILYLKLGFEIYGLKENYYGDGQPRLLLKNYRE
jgi:ribosomal-protein-alanine N-acetyltransferase